MLHHGTNAQFRQFAFHQLRCVTHKLSKNMELESKEISGKKIAFRLKQTQKQTKMPQLYVILVKYK